MIDRVEAGDLVQELPLHMTCVRWFETQVPCKQIEVALRNLLHSQKPIKLLAGKEDLFGVRKNVPVNRIIRSAELLKFHKTIVTLLNSLPVIHTNPQWINDGWNPHVTHKQNRRMCEGDEFLFNSVSIVSSDDYESGKRQMLSTIDFS